MNSEEFKKERKWVFRIVIVIFLAILFLSFKVSKLDNIISDMKGLAKKMRVEAMNSLYETAINQAERRADNGRTAIRSYFKNHPNFDIRLTNDEGLFIYQSHEVIEELEFKGGIKPVLDGEKIAFDPTFMTKVKRQDFYTDIYSKDGMLILEKALVMVNYEKVKQLFDDTGLSGVKMFGETGDIIIVRAGNGAIAVDYSQNCAAYDDVIQYDKNSNYMFRSMYLDHFHKNAEYKEAMKYAISQYMWKKNGINIYPFTMKKDSIPLTAFKDKTILDFNKYPLSYYNREFQRIEVFEDEFLGLNGTDIQYIISFSIQEQELVSEWDRTFKIYNKLIELLELLEKIAIWIPRFLIGLIILFSTVGLAGIENNYRRMSKFISCGMDNCPRKEFQDDN